MNFSHKLSQARVVAVGESRDDWRRQGASVVAEEVDLDWGQVRPAGQTWFFIVTALVVVKQGS